MNATHFALIAIDGLSSREIIKFKYRPHNHTYYYLCESDWETEYLYNASLNKDIYKNAEFGALAIQTACLMNTGQDNFKETIEVEKISYLHFKLFR